MFEVAPHTDVTVAPPGDQRPWMNATNESQVLMFFQAAPWQERRDQHHEGACHLPPRPSPDFESAWTRWLDAAADRDRHHHAHKGSRTSARGELCPPPRCPLRFSRRYFAVPKANPALYADATLT
jgi:hypothetical protein